MLTQTSKAALTSKKRAEFVVTSTRTENARVSAQLNQLYSGTLRDGDQPLAWEALQEKNGTLEACVEMDAEETDDGDTKVYDEQCFQVYSGPYRVLEIPADVDTYSRKSYTDNDEEEDVFTLPNSELVRMFIFVGDTHGDDAGLRTSVEIKFNEVDVLVEP